MLNRSKLVELIKKFSKEKKLEEFISEATGVGLIKQDELIDGYYYEGIGASASLCRWEASNKLFHFKFYGMRMPACIKNAVHPEKQTTMFEFFFPYKIVKKPEDYHKVEFSVG